MNGVEKADVHQSLTCLNINVPKFLDKMQWFEVEIFFNMYKLQETHFR